jgi:hypothetical protein
MAKTYYYDYLGDCYSRQVTMLDLGCQFGGRYENLPAYSEFWTQTLRFVLDSTAPVNIDVYFSYHYSFYSDLGGSYEEDVVRSVRINAGQISGSTTFTCYTDSYEDYGSGGWAYETTEVTDVQQMDQPVRPISCINPDCDYLTIVSGTTTTPSRRGEKDGNINVYVTGATGTTISYSLNGFLIDDEGPTSGYTYTGLSSGIYYVQIEDDYCFQQSQFVVAEGEFRTGDFVIDDPTRQIKAVENPIILNLRTAINDPNPEYSINVFEITGTISDVIIEFDLTFPYQYSSEFRSAEFPDRSTYFLATNLTNSVGVPFGTNTNEEIATSLAEVLQKDPVIGRLYYIINSGTSVTLTSREYGEGYDLDTRVTITGSNLTLTTTNNGQARFDGQLSENYSLYTELLIDENLEYGDTPSAENFRRITELELPFDNSNEHQFNLATVLRNFVDSDKFDFNFTGVTYMTDVLIPYYCKYGEKYPLITNSNTKKKRYKGETGYGWAMNSSLPFNQANNMVDYFGTSGSTYYDGFKFLNTAPDTKYSHRDAKEFMSFVISKDYSNALAVYAKIYLYDGTEYSDVKMFDITTSGSTFNFGGVAVVSIGYDNLNLSSYETVSNVRQVDVNIRQLVSGTYIPYSETKSYRLDIDEQPANFQLAFLNKLGTYETFTFIGELQESATIERESYQRPYPVIDSGEAFIGFRYNATLSTEYVKKYTINTGFIDADTFYFLEGLLQSNYIYRYDQPYEKYIRIESESIVKSTNDNQYSIQMVVIETITENNVI